MLRKYYDCAQALSYFIRSFLDNNAPAIRWHDAPDVEIPTKTTNSYKRLIDGEVEMIFVPASGDEVKQYAKENTKKFTELMKGDFGKAVVSSSGYGVFTAQTYDLET